MIEIILEYKKIEQNICEQLNKAPLKKEYIIHKSGIKVATFYRKLKGKSFTTDEMLRLANILESIKEV